MKRFACVLAVLAIVGLAVSSASATIILPGNNGFETPITGGAVDCPAEMTWTCSKIGDNAKSYVTNAAWANVVYTGWSGWVGDQVMMLMNGAGIHQDVDGFLAGSTTVSFLANIPTGQANPITVKLGDTVLAFDGSTTVTPSGGAFVRYTSDPIIMAAGTHTLSFGGPARPGGTDRRTGIDDVYITTVPEPSALVLLATGLIGLLCYAWRKRK